MPRLDAMYRTSPLARAAYAALSSAAFTYIASGFLLIHRARNVTSTYLARCQRSDSSLSYNPDSNRGLAQSHNYKGPAMASHQDIKTERDEAGVVRVDVTHLSLVSLKQLLCLYWVVEPMLLYLAESISCTASSLQPTDNILPVRRFSQLARRTDLSSLVVVRIPTDMRCSIPQRLLPSQDDDNEATADGNKRLLAVWLAQHVEQLQAFMQQSWWAPELRCTLALVRRDLAKTVNGPRDARWAVEFRPLTAFSDGIPGDLIQHWSRLCRRMVSVAEREPHDFREVLRKVDELSRQSNLGSGTGLLHGNQNAASIVADFVKVIGGGETIGLLAEQHSS